jgi:pimeloyl-ACP methyl ester carboxylesterase
MNINGIEIFVEKLQGKGDLNFVLIHNAGGNHRFFTHQIETFKNYGNVIQLDLPGHGNSNQLSSYKMHELAAIVSNICEKLSLKNICLVGLNNGASIVISTTLNHFLPIKSIILIDPPIFMNQSFISEINNFIEELEGAEFKTFVTILVDALFINTDAYNKEIATKAFLSVDKKSLQNIFRGLIEWDANSVGTLKNISFPTLCILTDEHHCSYGKLKEEAPHFELGKVVGSKCWATLEVPDQVNAMISRFLKINKES